MKEGTDKDENVKTYINENRSNRNRKRKKKEIHTNKEKYKKIESATNIRVEATSTENIVMVSLQNVRESVTDSNQLNVFSTATGSTSGHWPPDSGTSRNQSQRCWPENKLYRLVNLLPLAKKPCSKGHHYSNSVNGTSDIPWMWSEPSIFTVEILQLFDHYFDRFFSATCFGIMR
uniref:Uncharacterized protein n=1 Tax=Romanomermis culicivorax TaxID=13658 RepID=A0A915IDP1_ROMCU